jgi:dTDP-4-amino-4,6-dideoxygalactose transaminase
MQLLVPHLPKASEIFPLLEEIDKSHIYSNDGPLNRRLCRTLAEFVEGRLARPASVEVTTVANGTIAIELALRLYAKADRRRVLLPSYTFIATAHAVRNAGFEPVFLDVDEATLALSPEIAEDALGEIDDAAAVIVVSPFGGPVDSPAWERFEERTGVPVVFDLAAAAAAITHVGPQPVCLSLHATKLIGMGEGGAVLSTDAGLVGRIKRTTSFGFEPDTRLSVLEGGNYRVSEYAAAIGLASLADFGRKAQALRAKADRYRAALAGSDVELQEGFGQSWVAMTMNLILPDERVARTLASFEANGVPWRRWYGQGCHDHPVFAGSQRRDLAATHRVALRTIGVPFHESMSDSEIDAVCRLARQA